MEKYLLEDEIYQKNFLDIVADKARSYGFQVSFINDEHDGTVDYYMCIYLDIYKDFVLEHFKAIAKYYELYYVDEPCSLYVKKINLYNVFSDTLCIGYKLLHMEVITKLYQRNNAEIPETIFFHFGRSLELHYNIILDINKTHNTRNETNKLLLSYKVYNEYNKQMYKLNNPYTLSSFLSENTQDKERVKKMGVFHKTGNKNNMPLKELKKYGETTEFFIQDNSIAAYNRKLTEIGIKYCLENPFDLMDYKHYKNIDNFNENDLFISEFTLHILKKDIKLAKEAINKLEFRGFDNITNAKAKEKLLNMDHIVFYVPSWYLQNFHTLAMKHNMNYYYFDNYEIEDIDQIPLITHASNFFILKKVMESCLINYIDVNRIYNPEKEVELYPEAKYYPDITGKHVDKPINIIRRKIKQIEKAYNY